MTDDEIDAIVKELVPLTKDWLPARVLANWGAGMIPVPGWQCGEHLSIIQIAEGPAGLMRCFDGRLIGWFKSCMLAAYCGDMVMARKGRDALRSGVPFEQYFQFIKTCIPIFEEVAEEAGSERFNAVWIPRQPTVGHPVGTPLH